MGAQSHSCVLVFETPWTVARQTPLSMEFSGQEYWSGLPVPPLGHLPHPGMEPASLMSPALALFFFFFLTTEPSGNTEVENSLCFISIPQNVYMLYPFFCEDFSMFSNEVYEF